ncbi:MAG: hypothetical protein AB8F95_01800 [Bacteroidia bacterium]
MHHFINYSILAILFVGILNWNTEEVPISHVDTVKPQIFAPGIICKANAWNFTPAFSKDGNTLYYPRWTTPDFNDRSSIQVLYKSVKKNGKWQEPTKVKATQGNRVDWPHISPDGKHFLVSYNCYHKAQYNYPNEAVWDDFDIWKADCDEEGNIDWESFAPIAGSNINLAKTPQNARIRYVNNETCPRMDLDGNLYFWTERLEDGGGLRDVYVAEADENHRWENARLLPYPINSSVKESGVAISADGTHMIFASQRSGGVGGSDLYSSRKQNDGSWSKPINLGKQVNSSASEGGPQFGPNGKRLYFCSSRNVPGFPAMDCGEGYSVSYHIFSIKLADIEALAD